MKSFKVSKFYIVFMLVLTVFASSSLVYAGSHSRDNRDHNSPPAATTPNILGSAALFGIFGGGAGMTNQGIYSVVNGDIGTTAASTLVTGFHDKGAVYTESTLNIGNVNGTVHTASAPAGSVPNVIAAAAALDDAIRASNSSKRDRIRCSGASESQTPVTPPPPPH